ncbi:Uncharacterised protein [Halioglobus japonicus]|nr:Uncharacterised protein [Halioglobus japonicus]
MPTLSRADLWSLEEYSQRRPAFRAQVMAHKKNRQVSLGEHSRLYFEDALTIRYQIQEMLRIEKVFEAHAIEEELAAYRPLIPDRHNWKATFMIEYDDPDERALQLSRMIGIEEKVWVQIEDCEPIYPIADEDLPRENDVKTSSVHFLRFELSSPMIAAANAGCDIYAGIDHPAYAISKVKLPPAVRDSLANDLQPSVLN